MDFSRRTNFLIYYINKFAISFNKVLFRVDTELIINLFIYLFICLFIYLFIYLFVITEDDPSTVSSTPTVPSTSCDIKDPSWSYTHALNGSYINTVSYTLQFGEPDNVESCTLTQGWYYYVGLQKITTEVPLPGQCGTMSPIYLQGKLIHVQSNLPMQSPLLSSHLC